MNRKVAAVLLVKVVVSAVLLALVLAAIDFGAIVAVLGRADPLLVVLWYLLLPLTVSLSAHRWSILAPGLGYTTAAKYTWIGAFFGNLLPGAISGDVAKGVSLALKDSGARAGLVASIVAERVIGLSALLVFFDLACCIVYLVYGESPQLRYLAVLALVLSLCAAVAAAATLLALRAGRGSELLTTGIVGRVVGGILSAADFYAGKPRVLARAFGISLLIHVVNIGATWVSFRALQVDAGLLFASVVYPILSVILLVPISISGIGVRDATLAVLFGTFGLPAASGVALSWLNLLSNIPTLVIGGTVQLWEMYRPRRPQD